MENTTFVGTGQEWCGRDSVAVITGAPPWSLSRGVRRRAIVIREMAGGGEICDLNLGGFVGARGETPRDARMDRVEPDAKVGADTRNLQVAPDQINCFAGPSQLGVVASAVEVEMTAHGL